MSDTEYRAICPECKGFYFTIDSSEVNDPDRLCPKCFAKWPGMTIEELCESVTVTGEPNG